MMRRWLRKQSPPDRFLSERAMTIVGGKFFGVMLAPIVVVLLLADWTPPMSLLGSFFDHSSSFPPTAPSFPVATAFLTYVPGGAHHSLLIRNVQTPNSNSILHAYKPVVVVGKIIIDEYGDPYPDSEDENHKNHEKKGTTPALPKSVSIGGGGPQAAFGAAAALAVWDRHFKKKVNDNDNDKDSISTLADSTSPPPPVIFVAPVGKDWTQSETLALESSLGASSSVVVHNSTFADLSPTPLDVPNNQQLIQIHLVRSISTHGNTDGFFTPRIRLWHDREQTVHWYALNDSFGPMGADGLWRNNPSAEDLSSILEELDWNKSKNENDEDGSVVLHVIAETWTGAAGGQLDFLPLVQDDGLRNRLACVGIEPVASGETVTEEDAGVAASVLQRCYDSFEGSRSSCNTVFWCPDRDLDQAIGTHGLYQNTRTTNEVATAANSGPAQLVAVRDGPRGSTTRITRSNSDSFQNNDELAFPAATLATNDGAPIDPTGAGNAYSGAMTALLGNNAPLSTAVCIATGVGAVVCEHEGLPPPKHWNTTLDRIASAAREVESKML